jgi:hypothetical protein
MMMDIISLLASHKPSSMSVDHVGVQVNQQSKLPG